MCARAYVCVVGLCVGVDFCVQVWVHMCVHVHVCACVCMHICAYVCMCVHPSVRMCLHACVYARVRVYVCLFIIVVMLVHNMCQIMSDQSLTWSDTM